MLILLSLLSLLLLIGITRQATRVYTGQGLSPCIYPELARTDAVILAPGSYAQGTVLGQMTTLSNQNEVQTITFSGTPTGGTFRVSFAGQETANITYSGTAATLAANVQAALEALSQVGVGNVTVAANSGAPQVTFTADLGNKWQPTLVYTVNGLTGGTNPNASVAKTTPGRAAQGLFRAYDDAQTDGTNIAKCVLQQATYVAPNGKHYPGGALAEAGLSYLCAGVWIKGYFRTADLVGIDAAGCVDLGRIVEGSSGSLASVATVLQIV